MNDSKNLKKVRESKGIIKRHESEDWRHVCGQRSEENVDFQDFDIGNIEFEEPGK